MSEPDGECRDLRRLRRGFGNDAVTGNGGRDNLSGEARQREVPGRDTAPHAPPVHAQHVAFACRSGEFNGIEVCPRPGRIVTAEIHSFPYLCQSVRDRFLGFLYRNGHQFSEMRLIRSDDPPSELQSLMLISSAVLCLKKYKKNSYELKSLMP